MRQDGSHRSSNRVKNLHFQRRCIHKSDLSVTKVPSRRGRVVVVELVGRRRRSAANQMETVRATSSRASMMLGDGAGGAMMRADGAGWRVARGVGRVRRPRGTVVGRQERVERASDAFEESHRRGSAAVESRRDRYAPASSGVTPKSVRFGRRGPTASLKSVVLVERQLPKVFGFGRFCNKLRFRRDPKL